MAEVRTFDHDVLVIGAGGAGLRAAIEALAQGGSVGVVSKSLLGKAHTVMAEGGIADRKSTRLNSSHRCISYAVFCLKKKTRKTERRLVDRRIGKRRTTALEED